MTAITVSAVSLIEQTASIRLVPLGEAVVFGDLLYLNSTDGKWYKADAADQAKIKVEAMAVTGGAADTFAVVLIRGKVHLGTAVTATEVYALGVGGGVVPKADLVAGNYLVVLGFGDVDGNLDFQPTNTGTQVP